jgi:hypothetical protein
VNYRETSSKQTGNACAGSLLHFAQNGRGPVLPDARFSPNCVFFHPGMITARESVAQHSQVSEYVPFSFVEKQTGDVENTIVTQRNSEELNRRFGLACSLLLDDCCLACAFPMKIELVCCSKRRGEISSGIVRSFTPQDTVPCIDSYKNWNTLHWPCTCG